MDVVLSKDPIHLLRVEDVKDLIEQPGPVAPSPALLDDYSRAPQPRQQQIQQFLISIALDATKSEILQQNAYNFISHLQSLTQNAVKLSVAAHVQERIGRRVLDDVASFFQAEFDNFRKVGVGWRGYPEHGQLLRSFEELGAFASCPATLRKDFLKWMVLTFIGEPGGTTSFGNTRHVFYSNTAAPMIEKILREHQGLVGDDLRELATHRDVVAACHTAQVKRRLDQLLDLL